MKPNAALFKKFSSVILIFLLMISTLISPLNMHALADSSQPDLTVTGITTPATIQAGQQVSVTAAVYNQGDIGAVNPFTVTLYANGQAIQDQTVSSLVYGQTVNVTFSWTPAQPGDYMLKVVADSGRLIAESDETNNEMIKSISVSAQSNGRYVINLVIDGLSDRMYDQIKASGISTPNIDALIENGARLHNVKTVIPSYGGSQAAALTGASTTTNKFFYRYYDRATNSVKNSPSDAFKMEAQTIFEKLRAGNTGIRVLATGWNLAGQSIDGRGVFKTGDNDYQLKEYALGDNLVSIATVADDIISAIRSADTPRFMTGYSNDIKMVGWKGTDANTPQKLRDALTLVDGKVGEIMAALRAKGITDKTVIILNSLTCSYTVGTKVTTSSMAKNITDATGVKVVESSGGTVSADAKAVLIKQYIMAYAQLYFTSIATDDDKTKVLNYLNDKNNSIGAAIETVYSAADLGLSTTYCDYILNPVEGTTFCAAGSGVYRTDDLHDMQVFFAASGSGIPKGSGVKGNPNIIDIVPLICHFLGTDTPDNCEGKTWNFEHVNAPPIITITYPDNNSNVYQNIVTVTGKVDTDCTVTINGQQITLTDKTFSADVTLNEGVNTITVKATNDGGETTVTLKVNYVILNIRQGGNTVVYINWDGFANYYIALAEAQGKIPNLARIKNQEGVYFPNAFTGTPSITNAMQPVIVTGTTPRYTGNHYRYFNKEKNIVIQEDPARRNEAETIAEAAFRQNIDAISINQFTLEDRGTSSNDPIYAYINAPPENGYSDAIARFDAAISLVRNKQIGNIKFPAIPHFIALYMDDLDGIGHNEDNTYGIPPVPTEAQRLQNVINRLAIMDAKLGEFIQACKDAGIYDNMSFVLTTDHGMANFGAQTSQSDDSFLSKLPDLMNTINSLGSGFKCEVLGPGSSPSPGTDIVIVTIGLQAQLSYVNEFDPKVISEKNQKIIAALKDKNYVDVILQPDGIKAKGAKEGFGDLIVSPKPPYHFHTPAVGPELLIARGQHDSLADKAQRVAAFMWGKGIKKGYICNEIVNIWDFAPTMALLLGMDPPLDATGKILYDALESYSQPEEYKTTVEAESALLNGAAKYCDDTASNGIAVGNTYSKGSSLEFINVPAARKMIVHYVAIDDSKMTLYLNGKPVRDVFFPETNTLIGAYDTKIINITINKGDTVKFVTNTSTGGSGVNFDCIDFISENPPASDVSGKTGAPYAINMTPNGNTATSMGFAWFTDLGVTGTKVQIVKAQGDTANFTAHPFEFNGISQTVGLKYNGSNKLYVTHKAQATGLTPGTRYYYRVGDGITWSEPGSFTTSSSDAFTFIYVTDPQGSSESDYNIWGNTIKAAYNKFSDARLFVMAGDSIDTGQTSPNDEQEWLYYFSKAQDVFLNLPIAPALGNHEGKSNPNYEYHYNLPVNPDAECIPKTSVYSFDYGNAHFAVLNTEMLDTAAAFKPQIDWLRRDMVATDKKWKILILHKPLYSAGDHISDADIVDILKPSLLPVVDELGIDIVLQGHDHVYARSYPIYGGSVTDNSKQNYTNVKGTLYIVNNASGYKFYNVNKQANKSLFAKVEQPNKQVYTGISVKKDSITFNSYCIDSDEVYDTFNIEKADYTPQSVSNARGWYSNANSVTLTWTGNPEDGSYYIYEKDGKMGPNWMLTIPAKTDITDYSVEFDIDPSQTNYTFIIKSVSASALSKPALSLPVEIVLSRYNSGGRKSNPTSRSVINGPTMIDGRISAKAEVINGSATVKIDNNTLNTAFSNTKADESGIKTVVIAPETERTAKKYVVEFQPQLFQTGTADKRVEIDMPLARVLLTANMLSNQMTGPVQNVTLNVADVDLSALPKYVQVQIGNRPVLEINMSVDGKRVEWNNPDAPITLSIPYTPSVEELANPEHITIWHISGDGNIMSVPSGKYDPATGMVTFTTTNLGYYAVAYVTKTFDDLGTVDWAKKQIEVLASKGIIIGISEKEYAPSNNITRGDFLCFLVRSLNIDARIDGNFDDIKKDAYYYKEIAIAKKIGITNGIGNNKFNPDASITRQDMIVLADRALRMLNKFKQQGNVSDLEKFNDRSLIASYAVDSVASLVKEGLIVGSANNVNPLSNTTRAEAAVLLYRIYSKYTK